MLAGCRSDEQPGSPAPVLQPVTVAATAPVSLAAPVLPTPTAVSPPTHSPQAATTATPLPLPAATATPAPTNTDTPQPPTQPVTSIRLAPVGSGFNQPTFLTHAFDERLFIVEQVGRVQVIEAGRRLPDPFLDIVDLVNSSAYEQGLLSLAFHPDYRQNGRFFVNYTNRQGNTVIARYQVSDEPDRADESSQLILLTIAQPYGNHNGGQIHFGPDGYLYIGMGDGGSGGDPLNHGQNANTLLGALLRLDVDATSDSLAYAIPPDNPFVGASGRRAEIWATGLRNPWRFGFDRLTGDLYIADVGQSAREEVNFQPAASPGGENYGWNLMEGSLCFSSSQCNRPGLILPVAEYGREGGCAITGGYVYRGQQFPQLNGNYFFADYCNGYIWSLTRLADGSWQQTRILASGLTISSFGEDAAGELYLLDHAAGAVFQIQP
jgi:glucose/arabinose dehydrogenase